MKLSTVLIDLNAMVALSAFRAGRYRARAEAGMIKARFGRPLAKSMHVRSAREYQHEYIREIRHIRELIQITGGAR